MDYVRLGRAGLKVSRVCLGTMTFGREADEETSFKILDRFVELGGTFIDTADAYTSGASEEIIGRWLQKRQARSQVVLATKVHGTMGPGPNDGGLSRLHVQQAVDASLTRLQTDVIDLYQIHRWDPQVPVEETVAVLDDLVRAGKVRYIGASNYSPSQLMRALMLSEMRGWARFDCLQPEYSLLVRSPEWELLPLCREQGVGFIAWSPLGGGWLSGKYRRDAAPPADSRVGRADRWDDLPEQRETERTWQIIDALWAISKTRGKTPAQIALNWVLCQPGVTAPIFGARTPEQLEQNLGCVGWRLTPEELARLDEASAIGLPSPYNFIARYTRKRDGA